MSTNDSGDLLLTPLHNTLAALGATFTDFSGWAMPLQYASALAEHQAVRERAGIFDLSHMGEVRVFGQDAAQLLNSTFVSDLGAMRIGKAKYTMMCADSGGIVDDLIVYRLDENDFLVVPNASNAGVVAQELAQRALNVEASVEDQTHSTALIAVQGPRSLDVLLAALAVDGAHSAMIDAVRDSTYYSGVSLDIAGIPVMLARTGYTGEDGFEVFVPWDQAVDLWNVLMSVGVSQGLTPAGLAARDSLRLEAGMPLYGHELTVDTTPFHVGAGRVVSFAKAEDFPGRAALEEEVTQAPDRVLVGLSADTRRPLRADSLVAALSEQSSTRVGAVTSGLFSPTLGHAIAMALVDVSVADVGTALAVDVRGRWQSVTVTPLPFYRREH